MKITKKYKVESAHIVRSCSSERCSHSIHGHSAKIEVTLKADSLDNAQMIYDFGLMSNTIKQFIDSMDHCYLLCSKEDESFKAFIKENCDRWIEMPFNPSAEMLSMFVFKGCQYILEHTGFMNGEGNVVVDSVTYHETETGCATCDKEDVQNWFSFGCDDIVFSQGVTSDWSSDLFSIWYYQSKSNNPKPAKQIKFK